MTTLVNDSYFFPTVILDCENSKTEITSIPNSILISKNYPDVYDHNSNCQAMFKFEQNENIVLRFLGFKVEYTSECNKDYLEISSITNKKRSDGNRLCGYTLPAPIALNDNTAHLSFHSNGLLGYQGFMIHLNTGIVLLDFRHSFNVLTSPFPIIQYTSCSPYDIMGMFQIFRM